MKLIIRILKEIFDFFCGDWRVFCGVTITLILIELIQRIDSLSLYRSFVGIIFIIGLSLSLILALKHEITE